MTDTRTKEESTLAKVFQMEEGIREGRRQIDKKMFLEGFKASAEGFNGEYPFEGDTDEMIWERIKDIYKELKRKIKGIK